MKDERCNNCESKVSCKKCGYQLCKIDATACEHAKKPHAMEGYYLIDGEPVCILCHSRNT